METLKKSRILILILSLCLIHEFVIATAFVVTSNADAGVGSLRAAILLLNADATSTPAAPHTVTFSGIMTITLNNTFMNPLPTITRHCNINGGTLGNTVLNLANSANIPYGLDFSGANIDNSIVQNMVIHNSGSGPHVRFIAASGINITITNNRFGTSANGLAAGPRNPDVGHGVQIDGGSNGNTITNNLISGISGGAYAILIDNSSGSNLISGNLIGVDATGNAGGAAFAISNGILIRFPNSGNSITNNTISNMSGRAIEFWNTGTSNTISGNKIGTNSSGTAAGLNFRVSADGIHLNNGCSNNTIQDNIVSNCNSGIFLWDNSNNNIIRRNYVGTDITGNAGLAADFRTYWDGIQIDNNCSNNLVGGILPADGNVVCNSFQAGIAIKGANTRFNRFMNNKIGVGLNGVTALGNYRYGVYVGWGPVNNSIGAITAGGAVYGNSIANTTGNDILGAAAPGTGSGIFLDQTSTINNSIRGNSIFCNLNTFDGISWNGTAIPQSNVATPTINAASTNTNIFGSGLAVGDTIDLYYNETVCMACPRVSGITYIGTTIADASGNWSYTGGVPLNSVVTVTVTKRVGASFGNTSRFSPCSAALPLPIQLLSFTAQKHGQGILLNWSTSLEINNDYFLLQRSIDGIHFETIGTINGHGNSSEVSNYSFMDYSILNNNVYYKLVQVDYDSKSSVSPILNVAIQGETSFYIFPSLTSAGNTINLVVTDPSNKTYTFSIIDALGRTILSNVSNEKMCSIATENFSKGIYTVLLYKENKMPELRKFILE